MLSLLLACTSTGSVVLPPDSQTTQDSVQETGEPRQELGLSITQEALHGHLQALQAIANDNQGNREAWSAGYQASVDYVAGQLEGAGYQVELLPFVVRSAQVMDSHLRSGDQDYELERDYLVFAESGSGRVSGPILGVDLVLPPGSDSSSTSGCQASDFAGFPSGAVALLQRGSCTFADKLHFAQAAGATAVLIFNEGQAGRQDAFAGNLGEQASLPVLGLSFSAGSQLAESGRVDVLVEIQEQERVDYNIMARSSQGDPGLRLVVGAHLDSVHAGAGINDNGSGTAAVLETAIQLASREIPLTHQVQFMFWGAEEAGLLGSLAWLEELAQEQPAELAAVDASLNFDMLASPNGVAFLYDGDGSSVGAQWQHPQGNPPGSDKVEALLAAHMGDTPTGAVGLGVPSDSYGFVAYGIPTGGLFSGASGQKTAGEAQDFGGSAGQPYDACYHQGCDDLSNIDPGLYLLLAQATAGAVQDLAQSPALRSPQLAPILPLDVQAPPNMDPHSAHCGLPPSR